MHYCVTCGTITNINMSLCVKCQINQKISKQFIRFGN